MLSTFIEQNVLLSIISDKAQLSEIRDQLQSNHFSSAYNKWGYEKIIEYYNNYTETPNIEFFINEIFKDNKIENTEKKIWNEYFTSLLSKKIGPSDTLYSIDEIKLEIAKTDAVKAISNATDNLYENKVQEALNKLAALAVMTQLGKEFELIDWGKQWELRQLERKNKKDNPSIDFIPFPWPTINRIIGGSQKGEIILFIAPTNVGKSISLMLCGKYAFLDKRKVLHITLEDTIFKTAQRYDSSILGIEYNKLKYYDFTDDELTFLENKMTLIKKSLDNNLRIAKAIPKKTSVVTIQKILNRLKLEGFIPDIIILDYADLLIPVERHKEFRLEQTNAFWDLKTLAIQLNVPVITASQTNRTAAGNKAYAESISESYDKSRIADVIISLNQPDISDPLLTAIIVKSRDSKKGQEISMLSDYSNMELKEISVREE